MGQLTISDVARQVGLQASAIRYYEQIRLLPRAARISGQRRYDATALYRLAIIQRARQLGFTLEEIRQLFFGFRNVPRASARWRMLSERKLAELDRLLDGIKEVQRLLREMMQNCRCDTLDQCGKGIFHSGAKPQPKADNHKGHEEKQHLQPQRAQRGTQRKFENQKHSGRRADLSAAPQDRLRKTPVVFTAEGRGAPST